MYYIVSYKPLFETLEKKDVSTYKLTNEFGVSRSLIDRLKHNKPITTVTINDLCGFLNCTVGEILEYVPDNTDANK